MTPYIKVSFQQFFSTNGNQVFHFGNEYLILITITHVIWFGLLLEFFNLFSNCLQNESRFNEFKIKDKFSVDDVYE